MYYLNTSTIFDLECFQFVLLLSCFYAFDVSIKFLEKKNRFEGRMRICHRC